MLCLSDVVYSTSELFLLLLITLLIVLMSYRSRVIVLFSMSPSTSVLRAAGKILIKVFEANLRLKV